MVQKTDRQTDKGMVPVPRATPSAASGAISQSQCYIFIACAITGIKNKRGLHPNPVSWRLFGMSGSAIVLSRSPKRPLAVSATARSCGPATFLPRTESCTSHSHAKRGREHHSISRPSTRTSLDHCSCKSCCQNRAPHLLPAGPPREDTRYMVGEILNKGGQRHPNTLNAVDN